MLRTSPSRGLFRGLAVFTVAWVALWIGMGFWVRHEVRTLRQLSDTVVQSGGAVRQTGGALQGLREIPFVGGDIARVGRAVTRAGVNAQTSGRSSRVAVNNLANLLGVTIAVVPSLLMLALFLVGRRLAIAGRAA